ncbi:MAG: SxtJ family membrane protein [Rhodospirillaceae bacterium]
MSATHETIIRHEAVRGSSDRGFGIVMAAFFAVVGVWPVLFGGGFRPWSLALAAAFAAAAAVRPSVLAPLNWLWTRLGLLLHRVMNPIIMGLIFYVAVTPTALVMRGLLRRDLLRLKFDRAAATYWIDRQPPGPPPDTMKNQF